MTRPPFPWLPYWLALAAIFIGALVPIGVTLYAAAVAEGAGCILAEGTPCLIDGVDKGPELRSLGGSFIYALFTWPAGIVLACLWFALLYWHRRRWSRKAGFDD